MLGARDDVGADLFGEEFVAVVDALSVDEDVSDCDGVADAMHGIAAVATTPAPMPNATANAPMRPMSLACPMVSFLPVAAPQQAVVLCYDGLDVSPPN